MREYRTGSDAEHPIVLYEYQPGRGKDYPKAFLERFRGYLQTDGYAAYNSLTDVTHVGCLAHVRRKFNDALEVSGKGKKSPAAAQGVAYCTKLFKIEEQLKDLTPEERQKKRSEQAKPVLDAILAWSKTRTAAPKSKLGIALNYLKNQWPTLITYLEDGRIELSNNRAERSIKPFVTVMLIPRFLCQREPVPFENLCQRNQGFLEFFLPKSNASKGPIISGSVHRHRFTNQQPAAGRP